MRERLYRTEAIVLRRTNLAEADRIVLLASPLGKRRVVARGVRKTTSRLAGHIELFTHTRLLLARGRNLDIITQSQTIRSFAPLRSNLHRINAAYYVADLYDHFTQADEANDPLFNLLLATFTALDATRNIDLVVRAYELRLLHIAGYRPQLHRCAISGDELTPVANRFSPTHGGVLAPDSQHLDPYAMAMDEGTFRLLRYMQQQPFTAIERLDVSDTVRSQAAHLLRAYLYRILERDLPSWGLVSDDTADMTQFRANPQPADRMEDSRGVS